MNVTSGQHLSKPFGGLVADDDEVLETACYGGYLLSPDAASVDHIHQVITVPVTAGRFYHQVERLGVAEVAGVHDHHPVAEAVFTPVFGEAVQGPEVVGVDEVGDGLHHRGAAESGHLGCDVFLQVG